MTAHALGIEDAVEEKQGLDQLPDAVLSLWAPGDSGVCNARPVQCEKVGIERKEPRGNK